MEIFKIEMFGKIDHINSMSLRAERGNLLVGSSIRKATRLPRSARNDISFLITRGFYMPENFGIFVCTTARLSDQKG